MVDNNNGDDWSMTSLQLNMFKLFLHTFWITMYYVFGFGIHIIFNMAVPDGIPLKSISTCFLPTDFSRTEQMLYAVVHMMIFSRIIHYADKLLIRPRLNAVLDIYPVIYYILSTLYFGLFFLTSVYHIFSTFYGRFHIAIDDNTEEYSINYYLNAFLRSSFKESPANVDAWHYQESRNTAQFFLAFMYILYCVDSHTHANEYEAISQFPLTSNNIITLTVGLISNMGFFVLSAILSFALNAATYVAFNSTFYNDFLIILTCFVVGMVVYTFEELNSRRRLTGNINNDIRELTRRKKEKVKPLLVDQISFIFGSFFLVYLFFQADGYIYEADARAARLIKGVTYSDNYWQVYSIYSLYQATAGLCTYAGIKLLLRVYDVTITVTVS